MAGTQIKEGEYTTTIYGMVSVFFALIYRVIMVEYLLTAVAREQNELYEHRSETNLPSY